MSETAERNHPATPQRRRQALTQGHVARSHDLVSAGLILCGIAALSLLGASLVGSLMAVLGGQAWLVVDSREVHSHLIRLALGVATALLPILGIMVAAAVLLNMVQSRFVLFPQREWIDPQRLHPGRGWSRMLSMDSVMSAWFGLVKVVSVAALTAWCAMQQHDALVLAAAEDFLQLGARCSGVVLDSIGKIGLLLLVLGGLDYAYRWWRHERSLQMSPDEIRSEQRMQRRGFIQTAKQQSTEPPPIGQVGWADANLEN